jgi:4-hydroxythreonine-4-phosphate dehydrogenase
MDSATLAGTAVVLIGNRKLLEERAHRLGRSFAPPPYVPGSAPADGLSLLDLPLAAVVRPGHLEPANAPYVLETIDRGIAGCLSGEFRALVTGPVHKAHLKNAGLPFEGHTEYLGRKTGSPEPVMMFVTPSLRVALVTTHVALRDVPRLVDAGRLDSTLVTVARALRERYGIPDPEIGVLGLNPHAGEGGLFGDEEERIIRPVLEAHRLQGLKVSGPWPADTALTPHTAANPDAWISLYHDQTLPVIKYAFFETAVNVTLGLPFLRTSVDHGTALELAGSGKAQVHSLRCALDHAIRHAPLH